MKPVHTTGSDSGPAPAAMVHTSVSQIARNVAQGSTTCEQVARLALERADRYDAIQPQAWISRRPPAEVLERARRVDARVAAGEQLPLAGVPYAVKDNIDVQGLETTAGCPQFAYLPKRSATVVERLEAAGAVLLGKTNLDQFATGLAGTRSPYGATRCVFNRDYISGGSSSGSAVVVAAGIVPLALGSDTAGSGRVPAAFNGLIGYKPSRGRWSTLGLVPACRSLDCVTGLTHDAAGAMLVDQVLAAFDDADPYSRLAAPPRPSVENVLRFGLARADQLDFLGDREAQSFFERVPATVASYGGVAIEIDIAPLLQAAQLLYSGPWIAERLVAVEDLLRSRPDAIHPVVRSIVQAGAAISGTQAFRGLHALQQCQRQAQRMWEKIDVLVLPTTPTIYRVAELLAEPVALNSNLGRFSNFVNLLDMCAVAVPAGFRTNGTGFGVSLIGPAGSDPILLELAQRHTAAAGCRAPPLDLSDRPATVKLAVVGAHLSGMPLSWQLSSRQARLLANTRTAAAYRLYALRGQSPPKPALVHVGAGGCPIEVEVYELDLASFGSFVAEVPAPLAIGSVDLLDGSTVRGFVAEPRALDGAHDITSFGGWRSYMSTR